MAAAALATALAVAATLSIGVAGAAKDDLTLVSRADGVNGAPAADGEGAGNAHVSADGRYVAFVSDASNLVPGLPGGPGVPDVLERIYVRDTVAGTTTLVSRADGADGDPADGQSLRPSISDDGRRVAFESVAANLPAGGGGIPHVYVRDIVAGTTTLASRADGVAGAPAVDGAVDASLSGDGRHVAFTSFGSRLDAAAPDDLSAEDIFVRDLATHDTTLISRNTDGIGGDSDSGTASISTDGTAVAFRSAAINLSPVDEDDRENIFVRRGGVTTLVSRASGLSGVAADGSSSAPEISADGRRVAFVSIAENLSDADAAGATLDVFLRDLDAATTTLVSRAGTTPGDGGDEDSLAPALSADGRYVAFESTAPNLGGPIAAGVSNVYVRDTTAGATTLVSRQSGVAGVGGDEGSYQPSISRDGRYVAFESFATNLGGADGIADVFMRDVLGPPAQPPPNDPPPGDVPGPPAGPPPADPPPADPVTPEFRERVLAKTRRGRVFVTVPGGKRVALESLQALPVGAVVDARRGYVTITADGLGEGLQRATFNGGVFKIRQTIAGRGAQSAQRKRKRARRRAVTELRLVGKLRPCRRAGRRAEASARRSKRRLWGNGKGRFRTKGKHSSATVRGTRWLVEDRCGGTLTLVRRGTVVVDDFTTGKRRVLERGQRYVARKP